MVRGGVRTSRLVPHPVRFARLPAAAVAALWSSDYGRPVGELEVADVRSPGEPASHMVALVADVATTGVRRPVVVADRPAGRELVDGNHRAVLAVDADLPALVIACSCTGPCPWVLMLTAACHAVTRTDGWEWTAVAAA